ncbi:hypothetical protein VC83_07016 [Pseudogymnoascus destructans]|uniref:Uncharacterized protein n=1 Tax=Pseudogymnoascus destructans TaxID=655981 RepID=A0A177A717_9PEZI|nr:uncharacterized protein VC83_07016 [Pseudogymnoascus destructans]OAF56943.1 hypothetical protein VC83_07016 [Pseudogymnoascus destructans]
MLSYRSTTKRFGGSSVCIRDDPTQENYRYTIDCDSVTFRRRDLTTSNSRDSRDLTDSHTEEIVDKSVDSYELPEVKLFHIGTDTHQRQYVEKADIKHTPRQRRSTAQNDYQTNHRCSYDRCAIRRHPEPNGPPIQEVKDLLVILTAAQTRIPSTPPVDAPIPTVEATEQRTSRTRNTPETVQLPPLRNTRSPSIPGSSRMHTEDPPNRYKKSTISEKILPLSDGVEHTFVVDL